MTAGGSRSASAGGATDGGLAVAGSALPACMLIWTALRLALAKAGKSSAARMEMMAITTNSSMSVNAREKCFIRQPAFWSEQKDCHRHVLRNCLCKVLIADWPTCMPEYQC